MTFTDYIVGYFHRFPQPFNFVVIVLLVIVASGLLKNRVRFMKDVHEAMLKVGLLALIILAYMYR